MREMLFWAASVVAVGSALMVITRRSPVASALWLVVTLYQLAILFVLLDAHFIGALQVLVYAGAIMVLFLFVIMLLNLGRVQAGDMAGTGRRVIAGVAGAVLLGELFVFRLAVPPTDLVLPTGTVAGIVEAEGAVTAVAKPLFQSYLVPFEITSVMLLAAIVGAVVLAKRKL
jgi:NADH-quinone oxidoreductase subunit J